LSTLAAEQDLSVDAQAMNPRPQDRNFEILHLRGLVAMHQPSQHVTSGDLGDECRAARVRRVYQKVFAEALEGARWIVGC
jgi:hypothetical protein